MWAASAAADGIFKPSPSDETERNVVADTDRNELPKLAQQSRSDPRLSRAGHVTAFSILIIGVLDVISTNLGLAAGAVELNGFVAWLQSAWGEFWFLPKLALQMVPAGMVLWFPHFWVLVCVTPTVLLSAIVVFDNFQTIGVW